MPEVRLAYRYSLAASGTMPQVWLNPPAWRCRHDLGLTRRITYHVHTRQGPADPRPYDPGGGRGPPPCHIPARIVLAGKVVYMTDTFQVSIVELCKRIGLFYKSEQELQLSSSQVAADEENWDKHDFLSIVLIKISELTGVNREDVAEFIHRCSCGANWSEWTLADGSTWPDISHIAKELIALGNQGVAQQLCEWLTTTHPEYAKKLGIPVLGRNPSSLNEDAPHTSSSGLGDRLSGIKMLPDGHYEPSHLSSHYQLPFDALRNRLNRWRAQRLDGFEVRENPKPRQSKYLYQHSAVWPIIQAMLEKKSAKRPANDQPKKL